MPSESASIPADLTGFQRDLLVAIDRAGTVKGLAVKDALEGFGYPHVNHGRLYPNLDALVEKGLVSKGQIDDRTNSYEVTQRGTRVLDAYAAWVQGES